MNQTRVLTRSLPRYLEKFFSDFSKQNKRIPTYSEMKQHVGLTNYSDIYLHNCILQCISDNTVTVKWKGNLSESEVLTLWNKALQDKIEQLTKKGRLRP